MQTIPQSLFVCETTPITIKMAQLNPDPFNPESSMKLNTGRIQINDMTTLSFSASLICSFRDKMTNSEVIIWWKIHYFTSIKISMLINK